MATKVASTRLTCVGVERYKPFITAYMAINIKDCMQFSHPYFRGNEYVLLKST